MRMHGQDRVRLVVELAAAVGHDVIFVLVRPHRDAVRRLLEEIDRGRRIEAEHALLHRARQAGVDLVEDEDHLDGLRRQPRHDAGEPGQAEPEELARKPEQLAQQVEAAEDAVVDRQQRLVLGEAELLEPAIPRRRDDRIAELVEMAEIDADAIAEKLLVERDDIRLGAEQVHAQLLAAAAGEPARRQA